MMQAFGRSGHLRKGDRVVSRIAVEKHNPHLNFRGWGKLQKDAYAHSQQIAIEMQAAVKIINPNHEMAQTLFARLEAGDRSRRLKRLSVNHQRAIADLRQRCTGT